MGFNSAFKGLKLLKTPGNVRLNNLNDPVLNVLSVQSPLCLYTESNKGFFLSKSQHNLVLFLFV